MHTTNLICTVFVVLILSSCASAPTRLGGTYSKAEKGYLYHLKEWRLVGRLAISAPKDSWSASIEWNHRPNFEKIRLFGPLGQGAVVIEMVGDVVTINRGGGNIQTSNHPEEFIHQQLGMYVPLHSLRYWAIGLPESERGYLEIPDGFVQDGWLVAYKAMQRAGNETLPHKMAVSKEQVKLKLIVEQWDLNGGKGY